MNSDPITVEEIQIIVDTETHASGINLGATVNIYIVPNNPYQAKLTPCPGGGMADAADLKSASR